MPFIGEVHEREEGVFEWTVKDFLSLPDQVYDCYFSPFFTFSGAQWNMEMYPNGQRNKSEGCIDILLFRRSPGTPVELDFSLGLKTTKNEIFRETRDIHKFKKELSGFGIRFRKFRILERQLELAPSGHLTIVCQMKSNPSTSTAGDSKASTSSVKSKIKYFEAAAPK